MSDATVRRRLRQTVSELELCSHVPAMNLEPSGRDSGEDIGGKRPPGGLVRKDDRVREWPLKSADYYKRRAAKARSDRALIQILEDAEESLEAYRRQPPPRDQEHPELGDSNWKRWVGESTMSVREIASQCSVSRQYVERVRKQYKGKK